MKISCIILSGCSAEKGRCLRHCLLSVVRQQIADMEIIIAHNDLVDIADQIQEVMQWCKWFREIKVLSLWQEKLSTWLARNRAAEASRWDLLIFLDDDVIISNDKAFEKIVLQAEKYDYGYGAIRHWTKPLWWFEEKSDEIFEELLQGSNPFENHIWTAPKWIRWSDEVELQNYSFISHFWFCKKDLFLKLWGFPDFKYYGMEDQALMFLLYKSSANYCLLKDIEVYHITHDFGKSDVNCLPQYYDFLIKNDTIWFNVRATFMKNENDVVPEEPIIPLGQVHYDYRIMNAYEQYKTLHSADLKKDEADSIEARQHNNAFSVIDFSILVNKLLHSKDLNSFICNSEADFDNLIPFLYACIHKNIIKINNWVIESSFDFKHFPPYEIENNDIAQFIPKSEFNQFPCDEVSKQKRVSLIRERYPFVDYMKIALIWDDDMIANKLGTERWIDIALIEKDVDVISNVVKRDNIHILEHDIKNGPVERQKVNTFITDPPYTLHGILAFLKIGLELIGFDWETKEFYLICNPTILWHKSMLQLQKILLQAGIYVHEIRNNFSHYELPKNFLEQNRMLHFTNLERIDNSDITYSSSSNIYVLRSIYPDLSFFDSSIDYNLMYDHYSKI